jgi:quercetin dioxygenase-like cupin family protein
MKMKSVAHANAVENPEGFFRRTLAYNDDLMLCHFKAKAGSRIPLHSHPASQIGYVISGRVVFTGETEDDRFQVESGDSYVFSGHVKHGAEILEDAEFIETFSPSRDEYMDF